MQESPPRKNPLPKTFAVPFEEQRAKKRSKDREKDRHESKRKHKDPPPDSAGLCLQLEVRKMKLSLKCPGAKLFVNASRNGIRYVGLHQFDILYQSLVEGHVGVKPALP